MKILKHPAAAKRAAAERVEILSKNSKAGNATGGSRQGALIFEHFRLDVDAMTVVGKPDIEQYAAAGTFLAHAEHGAQFWLADWLVYGDGRGDWQTRLEQVQDLKGYAPETIETFKRVARKVPAARRRHELTFQHHKHVESCTPSEQVKLLNQAVDQGWTAGELKREAHALQKRGVLTGQADLEGKFKVVYADPPWLYADRPPSGSGAQTHYPGMTVEQLCQIPVEAHTTKNAVLFLWTTAPMIYYSTDGIAPDPFRVMRAWGFTPKTGGVWNKVLHGFGHYLGIEHEHLLIATRGSCTPDRPTPRPGSVLTVRRSDVHSEKPEEARQLITRLYDGPYVELFARKRTPGWTCYGNQILEAVRTA